MPALCRECFTAFDVGNRCPDCKSPRVIIHPELFSLGVAHIDCDAFYAAVEKRDNPAIADRPVIIGGGRRGVVATCCYIARIQGVRSAMPMFKARALCPDAVILPGRMAIYRDVSNKIKAIMEKYSPAIEPLSLDEAFIDMRGTDILHKMPPAAILARIIRQIELEIGVSASVGLSYNKFLAKMGSDMDKPRGFCVIGKEGVREFLADKPVRLIHGVGNAFYARLKRAGIYTFADLQIWSKAQLTTQFGTFGVHLWHLARGQDMRAIEPQRAIKSISHEITFARDSFDRDILDGHIWRLCEKVAARAKAKKRIGKTITLKLKYSNHKLRTYRQSRHTPTQMAEEIYKIARHLLNHEKPLRPYRLIGVALSDLSAENSAAGADDFWAAEDTRSHNAERARDSIRARFGERVIFKGRALK